ncbi:DUF4367 domain-containing protein [Bacillus suaedaesalsae]|uniref:DUF4367 domain-containing protein n=1 Tax=Bacillus suaedaesalsae TaxID=2810349 RepID=A0ABS2DHM8_9BACI|nr:DUF4367 domain-containing protein [Bacillus suaedaesalsae]MBM6617992.1 DUF4367 domain-containing protein [Bacillus suaedaesalsae]
MEEKLINLRKSMNSTTHKGRHFTEFQKSKIKKAILAKDRMMPSKVKRYLIFAITPITISLAMIFLIVEINKLTSNPESSHGGTNLETVKEDWEPRNEFVKENKVLFEILPDPALTAKKSYGYIFSFTESFETFNGKKMAIYATHKDSGLQITIQPPTTITQPSSGYDSLQRYTLFASAPLSGFWKFKVVLDEKVYGDVILYIRDAPTDENQDYLLDSNLKLVDYDNEGIAVELKKRGIEHELPSKLPVKIIGHEIVEGNPNNPYAPKNVVIQLNGEDGVLFTISADTADPDAFFHDEGRNSNQVISINGNKGLYMEGVVVKWIEEDVSYLFTSNERLSKETMIKIAESFK